MIHLIIKVDNITDFHVIIERLFEDFLEMFSVFVCIYLKNQVVSLKSSSFLFKNSVFTT